MKEKQYERILQQLCAVLEGEHDMIANMANMSALLFAELPELNWAGFYLFKNKELILGPFQGKVACMHISLGKGVCGESAEKQATLIVDNVKTHANYISCDSAAMSEIVVPMVKNHQLVGVLDIDSGVTNSYDAVDQLYLEKFVTLLLEKSDF